MENHATFDAIRANEPVLVLRLELRLRDTGFGSLGRRGGGPSAKPSVLTAKT